MLAQEEFKRFNMGKKPISAPLLLLIIKWTISFFDFMKHRSKITKINMEGLKPPYLLLCNHNAFYDFSVETCAIFPYRDNYVAAIDGFIGREWLLRLLGCICKRKFTKDIGIIKHLRTVINKGNVAVLFPEARYSLCGTTAVLPNSLGKLVKFLNVPVVVLIMNGHHINAPFWNTKDKGIKTDASMKQILTIDEINRASIDEINEKINKAFEYDDYKWQKENKVRVTNKNRAAGLHKVLYKCPNCKTEYKMDSFEDKIFCKHCSKIWHMNEYGGLIADNSKTEFSHIPDWYNWEREEVRKEIDVGTYKFDSIVKIDSLPNARGYIPLGEGRLIHNLKDGFILTGNYNGIPYEVRWSSISLYSCHIEYNYLGKHGDLVDLNTLDDTYYIYPQGQDFSVTKISLAVEEIYKKLNIKEELE